MCKDLVRLTTQDVGKAIPVTDSKLVAKKFGLNHNVVTKNLRKYKSDFEEFGKLEFMVLKTKNLKGGRPEKVYLINEQQYSLLVTYFKNTDLVREQKKKFVKAFFLMKNELQARQETRHISVKIRKSLTDSIRDNCDNNTNFKKYAYSNYSKLVYKKILGKQVKKAKEELGLKKTDNIRNYLTVEQLEKVQDLESKIAFYIEMRKDLIGNDKEIYQEVKKYVDSLK